MGSSSTGSSWLGPLQRNGLAKGDAGQEQGLELTSYSLLAAQTADIRLDSNGSTQGTQPLPIHRASFSRSGSGSGLPSALTPPAPVFSEPSTVTADTSSIPSGSQQEQHPEPEPAAKAQRGVHWLPGISLPPAAPAPGQLGKPQTLSGNAGDVAPQQQQQQEQQQQEQQPNRAGKSSCRSGPLPQSDSPQLDTYLRYLLHENHPHKFLYFVGWGLSCEGCAAIGEFLRRDKRIKVVTLSGNGITDDGLELIAEGLAHNGSVLCLDLSDNAITSVGAIELAEALHGESCKVAELLLDKNCICDDGADALAAAAASSTTLRKLKLSGNPVSAAQLDVVQHVMKTREYKWSGRSANSSSKLSRHMRKVSSGLQFDIELQPGQPGGNLLARRSFLRLPPGLAVAALVEAKDPLESSIGMQAAHLQAELQQSSQQQPSSSGSLAAAPASEPSLIVMLAVRLACRGYDVVLRTAFPSCDVITGADKGRNGQQDVLQAAADELPIAAGLRHTFLRVSSPLPAEEAVVLPTVIVDPLFRDQFEMPHPTPRLQEALEALPRVMCLAEGRLFHLVDLLVTESAAAFQAAKLSLPPWRHTNAVMDKWTAPNDRCVDVVVEADSSPQALEQALQAAAPAS